MDQLKVKQIENGMDTNTAQQVSGTKSFTSQQNFIGSSQHVVISDGYIYWCTNPAILDEDGNSRMSMNGGSILTEVYQVGAWTAV